MTLEDYYYHRPGISSGTYPPPAGGTFAEAVIALSPSGYWRLGEPSGTAATDEMGTQDGVYQNTPTLGVAGITTDGDTAATFALATLEHVTIADNAAFRPGTNDFSILWGMSISAWPGTTSFVLAKDGSGSGANWGCYLRGGGPDDIRSYVGGDLYTLSAGTTLAGTGWHLLLLTHDRNGLASLYLDGSSTAVATVDISASAATNLSSTTTMYIATRNPAANFDGTLDEVALWSSTLISGAQYATMYEAL